MKVFVDIQRFTDGLTMLLRRHVSVAVANVTCISSYITPIVDMIVKSENNPVHELCDMLDDTFIPDDVASKFAVREVARLEDQLKEAIRYYRHNRGCVVYAHVVSDAHCVVEIDDLHSRLTAPPRLTDEERYLNELKLVVRDGGYVPERLRRLL